MWSKVMDGLENQWFTKVVLESTKHYEYNVTGNDQGVVFETNNAELNLPEGVLEVNDGLLSKIITEKVGNRVTVTMILEHPADYLVQSVEGFPFKIEILLQRSALVSLLRGRRILLDPGHGGNDTGAKGLVGLYEKDVVLSIAHNLAMMLEKAQGKVSFTRVNDKPIDERKRLAQIVETGAEIYISIHTHASESIAEEGIGTLYAPDNYNSKTLAGLVQEGMVSKLKAVDRGIKEFSKLSLAGKVPAIQVEALTITNLVEEVFLRGTTVLEKAAEGIFIGLVRYSAKEL
jgi:N-acetylmuramoyl-L-alanine amidase